MDLPTLTCLPGIACNSLMYSSVIRYLNAGAELINLPELDTIESIASTILSQTPGRIVPVGVSMGGYIVLEMLRQGSDKIAGAVLIATQAAPDSKRMVKRRSEVNKYIASGQWHKFWSLAVPGCFANRRPMNRTLRDKVVRHVTETSISAFQAHNKAMGNRPDYTPVLSKIDIPTLVVAGEDDKIISKRIVENMASQIRGCRFVTLVDCGHLPTWEQPRNLAEIINTWYLDTFMTSSKAELPHRYPLGVHEGYRLIAPG